MQKSKFFIVMTIVIAIMLVVFNNVMRTKKHEADKLIGYWEHDSQNSLVLEKTGEYYSINVTTEKKTTGEICEFKDGCCFSNKNKQQLACLTEDNYLTYEGLRFGKK